MEFDRTGLHGAVEIYVEIQNGKAILDCRIFTRRNTAEELLMDSEGALASGDGGTLTYMSGIKRKSWCFFAGIA